MLSAVSAWSLLLFGAGSLLVSCFGGTFVGGLVGLGLLVHGGIELRLRLRLIETQAIVAARWLAYNQLALAATILFYLGWQVLGWDSDALDAVLAREPIAGLLQMFPPEVVETLRRDLPLAVLGSYGLAAVSVLLGCLGMAAMYWRSVRRG